MIKGIRVLIPKNIKTLVYKATKNCKICCRSCSSGVYIGDTTVSLVNGYRLISQECSDFEMSKDDGLYAIADCPCSISLFISS
jgi:hypothetical protein